MNRRFAGIALATAAVNLGGLTAAAPADAWMRVTQRITQPPIAVPKPLQPIAQTASTAVSFVIPNAPTPIPPPSGSLGASPTQILFGNATTIGTPEYWQDKWQRLISPDGATFTLPWPADLIKPELLLPKAQIAKGPATWPLARASRDLSAVRYTYRGQTRSVADFVRTTETDAIVFLHNGALAAEAYANGYSPAQPHQPWSVTKSVVSALVGIAQDEGRVGTLQAPIEHYIPALRGTAWAGTTIQNLLEMESGIEWTEDTPDLTTNTQVRQWAQVWLDYVSDGRAGMDRNEFLASLKRVDPQGTKFQYNSGNTQVLAWLLEAVYGTSFAQITSEKLWQPAGMQADASIITDRQGRAIASQGLYSIPYDLARFGQLFLNRGRTWDGRQLISERWVGESTNLASPSSTTGNYAYQWWSNGADATGFQALGFQGNFIAVGPARCTVGVRLAHTLGLHVTTTPAFSAGVEMHGGEWDAMQAAVNRALGDCATG